MQIHLSRAAPLAGRGLTGRSQKNYESQSWWKEMEKRLAGGLHNGKNKQTNRRETAVNEAVNEAVTRRFLPVSLLSPAALLFHLLPAERRH